MKKPKKTQLEFTDSATDKKIPSWKKGPSLWSENTYRSYCHQPPRDAPEPGMVESPINAAKSAFVEQIVAALSNEADVRTAVFADLERKQREILEANAKARAQNQIARPLAFYPAMIDISTAETQKAALETIRAEMKGLQIQLHENKGRASKLMSGAVLYAKDIGDRLGFIKRELLKHGEWEVWIEEEDNFEGGMSTARAYMRIANYNNWKKIAPELYTGKLTIEKALELIRKRPPEKVVDPDDWRPECKRKLTQRFKKEIDDWSTEALVHTRNSNKFMRAIRTKAEHFAAYLKADDEKQPWEPNKDRLALRLMEKFANWLSQQSLESVWELAHDAGYIDVLTKASQKRLKELQEIAETDFDPVEQEVDLKEELDPVDEEVVLKDEMCPEDNSRN